MSLRSIKIIDATIIINSWTMEMNRLFLFPLSFTPVGFGFLQNFADFFFEFLSRTGDESGFFIIKGIVPAEKIIYFSQNLKCQKFPSTSPFKIIPCGNYFQKPRQISLFIRKFTGLEVYWIFHKIWVFFFGLNSFQSHQSPKSTGRIVPGEYSIK